MAIAFYISAHGFGHAVRACAIVERIPSELPVLVRTQVKRDLFEQELSRPIDWHPAGFDCGAVQLDAFRVDKLATLKAALAMQSANTDHLESEVRFLREHGVCLVASDIPSFPLRCAREAEIPGVLIGNFTWSFIYKPYLREYPDFAPLIDALQSEYALANVYLRLPFSEPASEIVDQRLMPLLCRSGHAIRPALAGYYDLDPASRWVLVYLGGECPDFDWHRLGGMANSEFLVLGAGVPAGAPVCAVDPGRFSAADVIASCQVVLAKPGYGIAADAIAANVPLVYTPRPDFAEYDAMHRELCQWGRAVCLDEATFFAGGLAEVFDHAEATQCTHPFATEGARRVARFLVDFARGPGAR